MWFIWALCRVVRLLNPFEPQTAILVFNSLSTPRSPDWRVQLGLRNGNFAADGDATKMLLKGRYHDGHVKCADELDPSTCHGFLQAVYAHDFSGEANMFFRRFQSDRPTPVTMISNATVEGEYSAYYCGPRPTCNLTTCLVLRARRTSQTALEPQ